MNDAQILDRLAAEDSYAFDTEMPASAWLGETAFAEIERRIAVQPPRIAPPSSRVRTGWLVAAGAFVAVVLVGAVLLLASRGGSGSDPVATTLSPTTTLTPSTSAVPPTTEAAGTEVAADVRAVLANLERAFNRGDIDAVAALMAPGAEVSLAPWVAPEVSPSSVSLPDRVATATTYRERIAFEDCLAFEAEIRCDVSFEDEFSDLLGLESWLQTWVIEMEDGQVRRIDVSGENPVRAAAMEDFQEFIDTRPATGIPPLLVGDLEWNRTEEGIEVYEGFVVFHAAVINGVPPKAFLQATDFFGALSNGNVAAAEALFAPGGQYLPSEADDDTSAAIYANTTEIGTPELTEYLTFWYGMLRTEWYPVECDGDATTITCLAESRGLTTLFQPGGVVAGRVEFTLSPEGIVTVVDDTVRTGGSCGPAACGSNGFDIRGFWRTWMPDRPEIESLWPSGDGKPPGGYDVELARAIIEFYPQYLVENGIRVPPEYLDGSLLERLPGGST